MSDLEASYAIGTCDAPGSVHQEQDPTQMISLSLSYVPVREYVRPARLPGLFTSVRNRAEAKALFCRPHAEQIYEAHPELRK